MCFHTQTCLFKCKPFEQTGLATIIAFLLYKYYTILYKIYKCLLRNWISVAGLELPNFIECDFRFPDWTQLLDMLLLLEQKKNLDYCNIQDLV